MQNRSRGRGLLLLPERLLQSANASTLLLLDLETALVRHAALVDVLPFGDAEVALACTGERQRILQDFPPQERALVRAAPPPGGRRSRERQAPRQEVPIPVNRRAERLPLLQNSRIREFDLRLASRCRHGQKATVDEPVRHPLARIVELVEPRRAGGGRRPRADIREAKEDSQ